MTFPTPLFLVPPTINHLLAGEPVARAKLTLHKGKIARFDAGLLTLDLEVMADGMLALAADDCVPQVTIKINPADLPLLLQNRERAFSYVKIEGDADFANTISQLSQTLQWEAEADLSKLVGDIAAVRLVAGTKAALQTARDTHQKLAENVAEYLLEEKNILIRPQAVTHFGSDVAKIRDDIERLNKRIEKLERRNQ